MKQSTKYISALAIGAAVAAGVVSPDVTQAQNTKKCALYEQKQASLETQLTQIQNEISSRRTQIDLVARMEVAMWKAPWNALDAGLRQAMVGHLMITEKLSQEEAFRYVMTLRMMGAGPDPNTNTFVKESQRLGLSLNQLVQQQTTLMQWNATVRDNMNTLGCDRISAPTPQNPGQPAANESQAEVSYRMVGAGMWFPQTGQPKGWDWSSREARTLEECAAICPHYRPNYSCKSFFYRSPDEGETAGRCDLHNFDRASGLIVEKDTVHSKPEWDYYEVAGGH